MNGQLGPQCCRYNPKPNSEQTSSLKLSLCGHSRPGSETANNNEYNPDDVNLVV